MFFKHLLLPNGLSGILRCEVFFDFGIFLLYEKKEIINDYLVNFLICSFKNASTIGDK
jgi:hypothetical protein